MDALVKPLAIVSFLFIVVYLIYNAVSDSPSEYEKVHKLGYIFSQLSDVKIRAMQAFEEHGSWPKSMDEIGFGEDEVRKAESIDEMTFYDGAIYVKVESVFGRNSTIKLIPIEGMNGTVIRWKCEINVNLRQVDYCVYSAQVEYPVTQFN